MSPPVIQVIPGRPWPIDAVTQKFAWLGRTSSGKTFACKRFVEQMLKASAQVLVVDTVGVWHGLRQGARGFDIPVLGGLYGDIPLEPSAGALVAEVAVSSGSSLVLDTSQMNDAERARFMTALGQRLFELKKASPGAMHIVLDEGQDSVPQNPLPNENMMLHEWVRIWKQGRAFGMGLSVVSQRPQEISKKALNQVEVVLAFQITGAHERKALEYWLSDKGIDTKLAQTLPQLEVGVPYVWSPQWLKIAEVTKRVLPIESADTSQTPKVGDAPRAPQAMKPIDLTALEKSMAEMVEKVKESDPSLLRKRIKELEAQLEGRASPDTERLQQLLATIAARDEELSGCLDGAIASVESIGATLDTLGGAAKTLVAVLRRCKQAPLAPLDLPKRKGLALPKADEQVPRRVKPPRMHAEAVESTRVARKLTEPPPAVEGLPAGEAAVLIGVFQYGDRGVSKTTLTVMTGYRSGYIDQCLVKLVAKSLVERLGPGRVVITTEGRNLVPRGTKPYPRGKKLIEYLVQTLPEGEGAVLAAIAKSKTAIVRVKDLGLSYKPGYIDQCLVKLVARRALQRCGPGQVQVHPEVYA